MPEHGGVNQAAQGQGRGQHEIVLPGQQQGGHQQGINQKIQAIQAWILVPTDLEIPTGLPQQSVHRHQEQAEVAFGQIPTAGPGQMGEGQGGGEYQAADGMGAQPGPIHEPLPQPVGGEAVQGPGEQQ